MSVWRAIKVGHARSAYCRYGWRRMEIFEVYAHTRASAHTHVLAVSVGGPGAKIPGATSALTPRPWIRTLSSKEEKRDSLGKHGWFEGWDRERWIP